MIRTRDIQINSIINKDKKIVIKKKTLTIKKNDNNDSNDNKCIKNTMTILCTLLSYVNPVSLIK